MVERAAQDYARILQSANLEREIHPICMNIEDMLARLDEFETLLSSVHAENNNIVENNVCGIISFAEQFAEMRERIDKLERFVELVNANVNEVEKSVDNAEMELNVTDYSLKGLLLKPLLAKAKATAGVDANEQAQQHSNLRDGEFHAVPIYKTTDYFGSSELSSSEEAHEQNGS